MATTRNQSSNCKAAAATLGRKGASKGAKSAAGKKLAHCRWKTTGGPKPVKKARKPQSAESKAKAALKKRNDEVGKRTRAIPATPRKKGEKRMNPRERYAAQAGITLTPSPPKKPATPLGKRVRRPPKKLFR